MIRTADAAKERLVTGRCGRVNVGELLGSVANELNEFGRDGLRLTGMLVPGVLRLLNFPRYKRRARRNTGQQCQTQNARVEFVDESPYRHRHGFVL